MTIATKFKTFCNNIRISSDAVNRISDRYYRITKQLNKDFWDKDSGTSHSLYVGSYGRDTDIHVSDIDVLFQLPYKVYERINGYTGNGQSALLGEVRDSLKKTYSVTSISGDGQVVKIEFTDSVIFEIVPCFVNKDGSYTYPDTHNGGSWKNTNPKLEIEAIRQADANYNGNLKNLCRMLRAWKETWNVPMGGLLIDIFAYQFLKSWNYCDRSYLYYDWMTRDVLEFLKNQDKSQLYWLALGSNQRVAKKGDFHYQALRCYNIAKEAIKYEEDDMPNTANKKWREIYGNKF